MRFTDQPITSKTQDTLHRYPFVQQLAQAILGWKPQDPLVLGLEGQWGDGKTSAVNMLVEEIGPGCSVLVFDPWHFNSQEELLRKFLGDVFVAASNQLPFWARVSLRRKGRELASKLTSIPISAQVSGFNLKLSDFKPSIPTLPALRADVQQLLRSRRKKKSKVLVIIDNLDRLQPDDVVLLLKLVQLCSDFPDFVFLLSYDPSHVVQALQTRLFGSGEAIEGEQFLRKIIQTDITLPAIDPEDLDTFINDAFNELQSAYDFQWPAEFTERFPRLYQDVIRGKLINNLRDAKRLVNSAAFTFPLVKGELNYTDWLIVETLRVFLPDVYELVRTNLDTLSPPYTEIPISTSRPERDRWIARSQAILDSIRPSSRSAGQAILAALFPSFGSWISNPSNPSIMASDIHAEWAKQQRIASPDYAIRFFLFRPPTSQLSDTSISDLIAELASAQPHEIDNIVASRFSFFQDRGHLKELLDKLILRTDLIPSSLRQDFAGAIAAKSPMFSTETTFVTDSEEDRAQALIFSLAASDEDAGDPTAVLLSAIRSSPEASFAIDVVLFASPSRNRIIRDFDKVDVSALRDGLSQRISSLYSSAGTDIFESEPGSASYVLYQWAGPLLGKRQEAQSYLDELFAVKPHRVPLFLAGFMKDDPLSKGYHPTTLDMERLRESYDIEWVANHAKVTIPSSELDQRERLALEEFHQLQHSGAG